MLNPGQKAPAIRNELRLVLFGVAQQLVMPLHPDGRRRRAATRHSSWVNTFLHFDGSEHGREFGTLVQQPNMLGPAGSSAPQP